MKQAILILLLTATPVLADDIVIRPVWRYEVLPPPIPTPHWVPDEKTKKDALMRAYHLNGDKMCCGFIDLSEETIPKRIKTERIFPTDPPKKTTGQSFEGSRSMKK